MEAVHSKVQKVLLSAAVPPSMREKLLVTHGMKRAVVYSHPTLRKNLSFTIIEAVGSYADNGLGGLLKTLKMDIEKDLNDLREQLQGRRIIFFAMRRGDVETIFDSIKDLVGKQYNGLALQYHSGMKKDDREASHKRWTENHAEKPVLMNCTSSFGTGVDWKNVRVIIQFRGCNSLVQYGQETGRAGRDSKMGKCVVL